ncbi:MAG: GntR family transcriptional regulator [Armatimonadota bacterium]
MNKSVNSLALYQKIYNDLEQKISSGQIGYLEQLPALPDLCRLYGVSEAPVRQALGDLQRAGLVLKQRGRGKGTVAVKKLRVMTIRVLLMEPNLFPNSIESVHEILDMITGIRATAQEIGADVEIFSPNSNDTLALAGGDTGYLILADTMETYEKGRKIAAGHGAPCVLVNVPAAPAVPTPCVRVDIEEAAFLGVNYLAHLGHRRIAYVGGYGTEWFVPRIAGYKRALETNNLSFDPDLLHENGGRSAETNGAAFDSLMTLDPPVTAIFAGTDYCALQLLSHARRRGIAVPERVSLCGYDDIQEASKVEPALTTVFHPRSELGTEAVHLLSRLLSDEPVSQLDVTIPPRVVVRASTAPH